MIDGFHGVTISRGWRLRIKLANHYWPGLLGSTSKFQIRARSQGHSYLSVVWLNDDDREVASGLVEVDWSASPIDLKIPSCDIPRSTLEFAVPASSDGSVFIAVFKPLNRSELLQDLYGAGVEVGPGTNPQVLPSSTRNVTYVEAIPFEEWALRNSATKAHVRPDRHLFTNYLQGSAASIPVAMNSLDFIFSSHVFEHLANPLGHLRYWQSLLRPHGRVVAIIPDKTGCRDYKFPESSLSDIRSEDRLGEMSLSIKHYQKWVTFQKTKISPEELMERQVSIHAHFYTPESFASILKSTIKELGFGSFSIVKTNNHKDFHVSLRKG